MSAKFCITCGLIIGSFAGGYIFLLWGGNSFLSFSSIVGSFIGGLLGIWAGFKIGKNFE